MVKNLNTSYVKVQYANKIGVHIDTLQFKYILC